MGLGCSVRFMIFKLQDCSPPSAPAIGFTRIALSFSESEMAKRGYDFVCDSRVREKTAEGFTQAMRSAVQG